MDHQSIFNAMRAVVEAPGYRLLKGYKNDFYVHDAKQLQDGWAVGAQYLWIVREHGTHLAQIGAHAKINEYASAALSTAMSSGSEYEIYHLSAKGVKQITHEEARIRLLALEYVTHGESVKDASGKTVATFTVDRVWMERTQTGSVSFCTSPEVQKTKAFLVSLNQIAMAEMVKAWGSWFCTVQSVNVDGRDIAQLLTDQPQQLVLA